MKMVTQLMFIIKLQNHPILYCGFLNASIFNMNFSNLFIAISSLFLFECNHLLYTCISKYQNDVKYIKHYLTPLDI